MTLTPPNPVPVPVITKTILALTTPKTFVATQVQINSIVPDLSNQTVRIAVSLLDVNGKLVNNQTVSLPFTAIEGSWTGTITASVSKALLLALA